MRGVMRGYEDEYNARKAQLKKQKELEDAEYRKQFVDVGALEKAEKEKEQAKKKHLLREQMNDLDLINKKKEFENQREKDNDKKAADAGKDDQKRIATPARARELGSDYIVVGRPITQAEDPVAAWQRCRKEFLG